MGAKEKREETGHSRSGLTADEAFSPVPGQGPAHSTCLFSGVDMTEQTGRGTPLLRTSLLEEALTHAALVGM